MYILSNPFEFWCKSGIKKTATTSFNKRWLLCKLIVIYLLVCIAGGDGVHLIPGHVATGIRLRHQVIALITQAFSTLGIVAEGPIQRAELAVSKGGPGIRKGRLAFANRPGSKKGK